MIAYSKRMITGTCGENPAGSGGIRQVRQKIYSSAFLKGTCFEAIVAL